MHIEFWPATQETEFLVPPPKPAKNYIPNWYKELKPNYNKTLALNNLLDPNEQQLNLKHCAPFLDSFTNGYIQESWTDISVEKLNNGQTIAAYASFPKILEARIITDVIHSGPYSTDEHVFKIHWAPKVPKGWSVLFTHPLSRMDLPFQVLSGIVDFDTFTQTFVGNIPFFLQKDFEGIIPAGTPMYQMIPIRRENWNSSLKKYDKEEWLKIGQKKNKHFYDGYKKEYWQKKVFK